MNDYEARRLANIKRNQALVQELGLERPAPPTAPRERSRAPKRRKLEPAQPTRASARIASSASRPAYNDEDDDEPLARRSAAPSASSKRRTIQRSATSPARTSTAAAPSPSPSLPHPDLETIRAGWTSWTPAAPPPTRDPITRAFHFPSHPSFTPNKSPEEVLREGAFGGSYWRPLRSRVLNATIADDWRELPAPWTDGLNVSRYLVNEEYDAGVNKFGVPCGQSIEAWEAAGWIAHACDVRGWFQWYCRFWLGRRCEDDERQVGRWRRCVGESGRWRRALLKKYVAKGVRSVFDDGDERDGGVGEVSPVVHQTCHHWAYEVRQEELDRFWEEGR